MNARAITKDELLAWIDQELEEANNPGPYNDSHYYIEMEAKARVLDEVREQVRRLSVTGYSPTSPYRETVIAFATEGQAQQWINYFVPETARKDWKVKPTKRIWPNFESFMDEYYPERKEAQ